MANSQLTATAGEHYVAYKIASLGFIPALVRQGSPTIDLLASNPDGGRTVGVQVKSTTSALRMRGRGEKKVPFQLQFPLGHHAVEITADSTLFCFVDLKCGMADAAPDVYVVPALELKREYAGVDIRRYSFFRHHRPIQHMEKYRNDWSPLVRALTMQAAEQVDTRANTTTCNDPCLRTALV